MVVKRDHMLVDHWAVWKAVMSVQSRAGRLVEMKVEPMAVQWG